MNYLPQLWNNLNKALPLSFLIFMVNPAFSGQIEIESTIQEDSQKESPFMAIPTEIQSMIIDWLPNKLGYKAPVQQVSRFWNLLQPRYNKVVRLQKPKGFKVKLDFWETDCPRLKRARTSNFDSSSDGRLVLTYWDYLHQSGTTRSKILLWDAETGKPISTFEPDFAIHDAWFLPDDRHIALLHYGPRLTIGKFENDQWKNIHKELFVEPFSEIFRLNKTKLFYKAENVRRLINIDLKTTSDLPLTDHFHPGSYGTTASGNKVLFISKYSYYTDINRYTYYDIKKRTVSHLRLGTHLAPTRTTFVKNSAKVLVEFGHNDYSLPPFVDPRIFNLNTDDWEQTIFLPDHKVVLFQPATDGTRFFIVYQNGNAQIWDTLSLKILSIFKVSPDEILSAEFSHSADQLVITETNGKATLLDIAAKTRLAEVDVRRILEKHEKLPHWKKLQFTARFTPNDDAILLFADPNDVLVWKP